MLRLRVIHRNDRIRRLARHMKTRRSTQALQRLLLRKPLANDLEHRHLLRRPLDLALPSIRQRNIFHVAFFHFRDSQSGAPRIEILKFPMPKLKRWIRLDYVAATLGSRLPPPLRRPRWSSTPTPQPSPDRPPPPSPPPPLP